MKLGIRVLGIDDSPFKRGDVAALVVGVICRKANAKTASESEPSLIVEGVLSTRVSVDGDDGTEKLVEMVPKSRFAPELHAILLNGIMLAGFNSVDIAELSKKTGLPVIALTRKKPDRETVEKAVRNVPNWEGKLARISHSGQAKKLGPFYSQFSGTDLKEARDIIGIFGNGPSRLAHIIASGIVNGESHGRA